MISPTPYKLPEPTSHSGAAKAGAQHQIHDARRHLLNIALTLKQDGIENMACQIIFALAAYIKYQRSLTAPEKKNFQDMFEKAVFLLNLDQLVQKSICGHIRYTPDNESALLEVIRKLPGEIAKCKESDKCDKERQKLEEKSRRFAKAMALFNNNKRHAAVSIFNELLRDFPDDREMIAVIADALFDIGHEGCLAFLKRSQVLHPGDTETCSKLGIVYRRMKNYSLSEKMHKAALACDPENSAIQFNLARCYLETRQWDQAKKILNHILAREPQAGHAQKALEYLNIQVKLETRAKAPGSAKAVPA